MGEGQSPDSWGSLEETRLRAPWIAAASCRFHENKAQASLRTPRSKGWKQHNNRCRIIHNRRALNRRLWLSAASFEHTALRTWQVR
jgi:hypothetical protein